MQAIYLQRMIIISLVRKNWDWMSKLSILFLCYVYTCMYRDIYICICIYLSLYFMVTWFPQFYCKKTYGWSYSQSVVWIMLNKAFIILYKSSFYVAFYKNVIKNLAYILYMYICCVFIHTHTHTYSEHERERTIGKISIYNIYRTAPHI